MKAKDIVLKHYPEAAAVKEEGTFSDGKVRFKVLLKPGARKIAGYGKRESSAWAETVRNLELK